MRHTFAVCAYKDSPYLPYLLESLKRQSEQSAIYIATSTPSDYIQNTAEQFGVKLAVNSHSEGIGADWNFAYSQACTDFVTLAHQDDYYEPDFTEKVLSGIEKKKNPVMAFTRYFEMREDRRVYGSTLLNIKKIMLVPISLLSGSRLIRRMVFSFGSPICCPSITYNKKRFPDFQFSTEYRCSLDWEAMLRLSKEHGDFIYIKKPLMGHRIDDSTETSRSISNGIRYNEDLAILSGLWAMPFAKIIIKFYAKSMDSNSGIGG